MSNRCCVALRVVGTYPLTHTLAHHNRMEHQLEQHNTDTAMLSEQRTLFEGAFDAQATLLANTVRPSPFSAPFSAPFSSPFSSLLASLPFPSLPSLP